MAAPATQRMRRDESDQSAALTADFAQRMEDCGSSCDQCTCNLSGPCCRNLSVCAKAAWTCSVLACQASYDKACNGSLVDTVERAEPVVVASCDEVKQRSAACDKCSCGLAGLCAGACGGCCVSFALPCAKRVAPVCEACLERVCGCGGAGGDLAPQPGSLLRERYVPRPEPKFIEVRRQREGYTYL